uniref:Ring finger and FYVE-like domain containing E3 ubiquitin protein ligase n=1 Tax=Oryzias sinensis TaxID=183150 RepID=A0A8C7WZU8_9TELE
WFWVSSPRLPATAPPEAVPQEDDQVSLRSSAGAPPAATQSGSASALIQVWDGEEAPVSGRRASLSDLSGPEDIEVLSVRQLKEILARNFVDYKGCCEKWELMERVTRLYQDQQNLLGEYGAGAQEEDLCRICMDSPIDCVLLECGHMTTCTKCGKRMSECPICRQFVVRAVHVFRP